MLIAMAVALVVLFAWQAGMRTLYHQMGWKTPDQESRELHEKEAAATQAEVLLAQMAAKILPGFLDDYPAIVWEDQDECLEVLPQDIEL